MSFDPAQALAYARSLARPRQVGTPANEAVIAELARRLQSFGCRVAVTPFEFSDAGDHALVYFVLAAQILLLITFWTWGVNAWAAVIPAGVLAFLLLTST